MTPVTQADKDRIERFLQQDLTNGLAEEHLWRLVADVRAEAFAAAIKACEAQRDSFLSPEYATDQPLSSFSERFACGMCITVISNLATK